jgi:hypothetical protein
MNLLHQSMEALFERCLNLSVAKNHDYAGDGDPLRNFRKAQDMGISVEQGIMVRLSDKFARLEGFFKTGKLMVGNEKIADTIMDVINYAAILSYALDEDFHSGEINMEGEPLKEHVAYLVPDAFRDAYAFGIDERSEPDLRDSDPAISDPAVDMFMRGAYETNKGSPNAPECRTLDELNEATRQVIAHQNDLFGPNTLGEWESAEVVPVNNVEKCKQMLEDSYKDQPVVLSSLQEFYKQNNLDPETGQPKDERR